MVHGSWLKAHGSWLIAKGGLDINPVRPGKKKPKANNLPFIRKSLANNWPIIGQLMPIIYQLIDY